MCNIISMLLVLLNVSFSIFSLLIKENDIYNKKDLKHTNVIFITKANKQLVGYMIDSILINNW